MRDVGPCGRRCLVLVSSLLLRAKLAPWRIRLIGGAWDVVFVVALECHHHRVAEPGPGPRRAECRRVARTVELARRCSGRLESSKTRR